MRSACFRRSLIRSTESSSSRSFIMAKRSRYALTKQMVRPRNNIDGYTREHNFNGTHLEDPGANENLSFRKRRHEVTLRLEKLRITKTRINSLKLSARDIIGLEHISPTDLQILIDHTERVRSHWKHPDAAFSSNAGERRGQRHRRRDPKKKALKIASAIFTAQTLNLTVNGVVACYCTSWARSFTVRNSCYCIKTRIRQLVQ